MSQPSAWHILSIVEVQSLWHDCRGTIIGGGIKAIGEITGDTVAGGAIAGNANAGGVIAGDGP